MIMSEWKEYRLGDVGKIVTGKTPKTAITDNYGGNIPFLSPSDNMELKYVPITARHLTEKGLAEVKSCLIPENSVCVSCIGSDMGKSVITVRPIVTNQQINSIIPSSNFDTNFLYYILQNKKREIKFLGRNGTAVPILNKSAFSNLTIFAPELDEQRSIASILSSLDSKIENNRKICANLEAQAQALFKHWFIDFAPFKDGKFVESELGMIPEGWRVGRLGDYCKVKSGYAFKSSWWTDKGNRIIKIKNISGNGNLDMKECSFVSPENCLKAKDFKAIPGDLIIAMTGATIGKFTIIPKFNDDVYINQRVGKFFLGDNPFEKLPFIYSLLKTNIYSNQIVNMGIGSAQSNISGKDIESIKIPYNQREISRFNHILRVVFETIVECQCEISRLSTLRDTLLPKLMSGEIKV